MIKHVPDVNLIGARVWYIMEKGELYVPSVVAAQEGPVVTLKCLTRPLMPRLDLNAPDHQWRIEFRTLSQVPGDAPYVRRTDSNPKSGPSSQTESFV